MGWLKRLFSEKDKDVLGKWEESTSEDVLREIDESVLLYGPPSVMERFQRKHRNTRNRRERETVLGEISIEPVVYGPPPWCCVTNQLSIQGIGGEHCGKRYVMKQNRITIGKATNSDIIITQSPTVSREHVEIIYDESGFGYAVQWKVVCKGRNGLMLGGKKLAQGESAQFSKAVSLEIPVGQVFQLIPVKEAEEPDGARR